MRPAADEVVAVILDAIRGGAYGVGDLLPKERELADQLGVSRPVVSQALRTLRQAGIVTTRRGAKGGTSVASLDNLPTILRALRGPMHANIRSILETRRSLESVASLLAAQRASDEQLAELSALAKELEVAVAQGRPTAVNWELDLRFHLRVAAASGNRLLTRFLDETFHALTAAREEFPFGHVPADVAVRNQHEYAAALVRRDVRAIADAVDRHLAFLEEVYLGERLRFLAVPVVSSDQTTSGAGVQPVRG